MLLFIFLSISVDAIIAIISNKESCPLYTDVLSLIICGEITHYIIEDIHLYTPLVTGHMSLKLCIYNRDGIWVGYPLGNWVTHSLGRVDLNVTQLTG